MNSTGRSSFLWVLTVAGLLWCSWRYSPLQGQVSYLDTFLPDSIIEIGEHKFRVKHAHVSEVSIRKIDTVGEKVHVVVNGWLPDGCTELLNPPRVRTKKDTFTIEIFTRQSLREPCIEIVDYWGTAVELDIKGLRSGEYAVKANGKTAVFTLSSKK